MGTIFFDSWILWIPNFYIIHVMDPLVSTIQVFVEKKLSGYLDLDTYINRYLDNSTFLDGWIYSFGIDGHFNFFVSGYLPSQKSLDIQVFQIYKNPDYGNTGCGVFKQGYKIRKIFA